MRKSRYSLFAVLVAVALFASACGGSDDAAADNDSAAPTEAEEMAERPTTTESDKTSTPEAANTPAAIDADTAETANEPVSSDDDPADATDSIRSGETIVWDDCDGLECAALPVAVDYEDPSLGTIDLALTVHRSTGVDEEWLGYLLVNPGGPGGSGLEFAQGAADGAFTEPVLNHFDIIGFDPRGVGLSEPAFSCGDGTEYRTLTSEIVDDVDTDEEIAIGEQVAALCSDTMGPVADRLGTANVVRDMDEIRKALGADDVSYYGASYGSAVGVWFATLFPDSVAAMVVDGAANPTSEEGDSVDEQLAAIREQVGGFEAQLDAAVAACVDATCPIYNDGDPAGYLAQASAKADLVRDASPSGSATALFMGVITPLYAEDRWPELYNALFELVENDNGEPLATIAVEQLGQVAGTTIIGQVNCLDQWMLMPDEAAFSESDTEDDTALEDQLTVELPLISQFVTDEFDPCPFLADHAPAPLDVPLDGSDVPILVIGNLSDPATPYVQSEQLAQDVLNNGYLVQVDHPSHVVYAGGFNECVHGYVEAMLIERSLPAERKVECSREEAPEATVEDVPEFMQGTCVQIAAQADPEADPGAVDTVCSELTVSSIEEFGAEDLLGIFTGANTDQEQIEQVGIFLADGLAQAGIG